MDQRKCGGCGKILGEENVMKIILEDGSCEVIPLSTCPECFTKELKKKIKLKKYAKS